MHRYDLLHIAPHRRPRNLHLAPILVDCERVK